MEKYFNINKSGCSIKCKLYYNDLKRIKRLVICGHGFGGHKDNSAAEKFSEYVLKKFKDVAAITFNAPCHGDDVKQKLSLSDCDTYIGLVTEYAKQRFSPEKLYYYATSFGGYLVLKYIYEHKNPFGKIVLRCPAVNMYEVLSGTIMDPGDLKLLSNGKPLSVGFDRKIKITRSFLDELKEADISGLDFREFSDSILIIHGTRDEVVSFDSVRSFAEKNEIRFAAAEGADHRFRDPIKMHSAIKMTADFFEL